MRILTVVALSWFVALPLQAAELTTALQQCLQLTQDDTRLQCYDQLARSLQATQATPTVQPAADPVQSFGLENRVPEQQVADLKLEVKSVRMTKKGRLEITMQNGQVWLQTDDSRLDVQPGDQCIIERATFGSFLLNNGRNNRNIRVRRVD